MKQVRYCGKQNFAVKAGLAIAVMLLTGCSALPVTSSHPAVPTGGSRLRAPSTGTDAADGGSGSVAAGSFPRSFLIPGTDTSIRIGG